MKIALSRSRHLELVQRALAPSMQYSTPGPMGNRKCMQVPTDFAHTRLSAAFLLKPSTGTLLLFRERLAMPSHKSQSVTVAVMWPPPSNYDLKTRVNDGSGSRFYR